LGEKSASFSFLAFPSTFSFPLLLSRVFLSAPRLSLCFSS